MVTKQKVKELIKEGEKIMGGIIPELNKISHEYIRIDGEEYRRKVDMDEMCLVLGLLVEKSLIIAKGE